MTADASPIRIVPLADRHRPDWDGLYAAYAAFFPEDPPALAAVGVAALPKGARVEIDAIVAVW